MDRHSLNGAAGVVARDNFLPKGQENSVSIPLLQKTRIGMYIIKQLLAKNRQFPLVLMLEPLFRCNLNCKGCGKIAYSKDTLNMQLSMAECIGAAEECGAPVVSIAGGEPLLHPDIPAIVRGLGDLKKFVYLCTNAQLTEKRLHEFRPSPYLTFNVHLDGIAERHDEMVNCRGAFNKAVAAIQKMIAQGYRVTTNTTLFEGETPENAAKLFDFLSGLGVEGMTVSPGYSYDKASDQEHFLGDEATKKLFRQIFACAKGKKWQFNHSSLYLDFLAGNQNYLCTPWGNPTRNVFGWQKPCYLLNDGYASSYRELLESTDWRKYGKHKDPRCANCMVHCGFEPTAVMDSVSHPLKAFLLQARGINTSGC